MVSGGSWTVRDCDLDMDLLKSTAMRSRAIGVAGADMLCQVDLPVSVSSGSVNPNSQEKYHKDT